MNAKCISNPQHTLPKGLITVSDLKKYYSTNSEEYLVIMRPNAIDIPLDDYDALVITGDEEFAVGRLSHKLPNNDGCLGGKIIHITVNGIRHAINKAKITIEHLRQLAGAGATDGVFAEIPNRADEPLHHVHTVVVQDGDAFITVPCGNVGDIPNDSLLERDLQILKQQYPNAYLQTDVGQSLVVIPNVKIPNHWNVSHVDILFPIISPYPYAALDMFWVGTPLRLANGVMPANAQGHDRHYLGKNWQGFSWHYSQPWVPNRDNLLSHLRFALVRLGQDR